MAPGSTGVSQVLTSRIILEIMLSGTYRRYGRRWIRRSRRHAHCASSGSDQEWRAAKAEAMCCWIRRICLVH